MKTKGQIRKLYFTELKDKLLELEEMRKGILKRVLAMYGGIATLLLLGFVRGINIQFLAIGGIIFFVGCTFFTGVISHEYVREFKLKVIKRIVEFVDENLSYSRTGFVPSNIYMESRIFTKKYDRYKGEDYVIGTLDKTKIQFSEIHSEYKTKDSKGRTTWHTIFKGLFFNADFNKHTNSVLVVVPDQAERMLGKMGQMFQEMSTAFSTRELIKMENMEFEKYFAVYGTDQVEARYILTPSLMEKVVEFRKKMKKDVYLSFINGKIFLGISVSENLFEPKLFKSGVDLDMIEKYFNYINLLVGIVEEFELNTRIWTKE